MAARRIDPAITQKELWKQHPELRRAYLNKWYAKSKERVLALRNKWAKDNPEKRKKSLRNAHLKAVFGINQEQWDALFTEQGRRCAICKCAEPRGGRWAVDHSHVSDKIRAILCMLCNTAIGKMNDDPELLRQAMLYLQEHAEKENNMATLAARTDGKVAQYQLAGTSGLASTAITPYDSGTILGTTPPGKAGIKLVSGVIQNAADLTVTPVGTDSQNFLACTSQPQASGDPTENSAQHASAGLSLAPQHE